VKVIFNAESARYKQNTHKASINQS